MKRIIALALLSFTLAACGTTSSLYYWGGTQNGTTAYENLAYNSYRKQTPESLCRLICAYEDIVSNPDGTRRVPPPGICAEYGYILLNPENATIFAEHATAMQRRTFASVNYASFFPERGKEMLQKEIELYPESAKFISPLIERLCK